MVAAFVKRNRKIRNVNDGIKETETFCYNVVLQK